MCMDDVMKLEPAAFFQYVKTIGYGYQDADGRPHFAGDADFKDYSYRFSAPEDVVRNNCGWCWDVAELIKQYCQKNAIPCVSYFMEYKTDAFHQTHTQVFLQYAGKWYAAPDNCLDLNFGENGFLTLAECVKDFVGLFTDYLQSVLRDAYDAGQLLLKPYHCAFQRGITDEAYLAQIRAAAAE